MADDDVFAVMAAQQTRKSLCCPLEDQQAGTIVLTRRQLSGSSHEAM